MSELLEYQHWFTLISALVAVISFVILMRELICHRLQWSWRLDWQSRRWPSVKWLIPLSVATRRAQEELAGTEFDRLAQGLNQGEDIFDFYAHGLVHNNALYATKLPFKKCEIIPQPHKGYISNGGEDIRDDNGQVLYHKLLIERKSLKEYVNSKLSLDMNF